MSLVVCPISSMPYRILKIGMISIIPSNLNHPQNSYTIAPLLAGLTILIVATKVINLLL